MAKSPRLVLIHATRVAIDPIETAASKLWPEAETVSILEEGLSVDRAKSEDLSLDLWDRIVGLSKYAERIGSDGVLFTCSAFGAAIEAAADSSAIPVLKPNEAMFDDAFRYGDRAVLIHTFKPAAEGMLEEFREAAKTNRPAARIRAVYCEGALDAKRAGDHATHDKLIAGTAAHIADADVIMLAQFSMASAALAAREQTSIPVLTSPEAAITEIKRRVESGQKG